MPQNLSGFKEKGMVFVRGITKYLNKIPVPNLLSSIVKTERISVLRKQYEEYLEEDKRRKQRNEHIIEILDKMSSSAVAVPIHNKHISGAQANPEAFYNCTTNAFKRIPEPKIHYYLSSPDPLKNQSLPLVENLNETYFLNEICKKYILIPKRETNYSSNNALNATEANINDNHDWKSKYDILEKLKQNEKEEPAELSPYKEKNLVNTLQKPVLTENQDVSRNESKLVESKYEYEIPEKDSAIGSAPHETNMLIGPSEVEAIQKVSITDNEETEKLMASADHRVVDLDYSMLPENYSNMEHFNETVNNDVTENFQAQPEYNLKVSTENSPLYQKSYADDESFHHQVQPKMYEQYEVAQEDFKESPEVIQAAELIEELKNEIPFTEKPIESEYVQNPGEITYAPVYTAEDETHPHGVPIHPESQEPNKTFDYEYKIVPESTIVSENVENPANLDDADATGIEAFEAEQQEMFYQESGDANNAQNQESSGAADYVDYNEPYQYYEGEDQAYPMNINEHEESSERYDPNYSEQYNYEYQYQQQNDYEQQQYEQEPAIVVHVDDLVETPQLQNPETLEHIQQQLDEEQNFVEKQYEQVTEGNPAVAGENEVVTGENPVVAGENLAVAGENLSVAGENLAVAEEKPAVQEQKQS